MYLILDVIYKKTVTILISARSILITLNKSLVMSYYYIGHVYMSQVQTNLSFLMPVSLVIQMA